jgi:hypothetical protein
MKRMRFLWLSLIALAHASPTLAVEHRWFVVNDTDAACEALDGPHAFPTPMPDLKTPEQLLALKKRDWPDAKLVPLVDFVAKRRIAQDSIPVDFKRITRTNALVLLSEAKDTQLLLLRDDACWKIDSEP